MATENKNITANLTLENDNIKLPIYKATLGQDVIDVTSIINTINLHLIQDFLPQHHANQKLLTLMVIMVYYFTEAIQLNNWLKNLLI